MTFVGLEVDDFELLQAIFPLRQHGVIGKQTDRPRPSPPDCVPQTLSSSFPMDR